MRHYCVNKKSIKNRTSSSSSSSAPEWNTQIALLFFRLLLFPFFPLSFQIRNSICMAFSIYLLASFFLPFLLSLSLALCAWRSPLDWPINQSATEKNREQQQQHSASNNFRIFIWSIAKKKIQVCDDYIVCYVMLCYVCVCAFLF